MNDARRPLPSAAREAIQRNDPHIVALEMAIANTMNGVHDWNAIYAALDRYGRAMQLEALREFNHGHFSEEDCKFCQLTREIEQKLGEG